MGEHYLSKLFELRSVAVFGAMRPGNSLNCSLNKGSASPGKIALVSQSGALCTAILDWAAANRIGFSAVVSTGIAVH